MQKRLIRAFRHTLGRVPEASEVAVLRRTYDQQLQTYQADPAATAALLKVGEYPVAAPAPTPELAAIIRRVRTRCPRSPGDEATGERRLDAGAGLARVEIGRAHV